MWNVKTNHPETNLFGSLHESGDAWNAEAANSTLQNKVIAKPEAPKDEFGKSRPREGRFHRKAETTGFESFSKFDTSRIPEVEDHQNPKR